MSWTDSAPLDALNQAAFTFHDVAGYDVYLRWLEQERSRVRVRLGLHGHAPAEIAEPELKAPNRAAEIERLTDALGFYADHTNYPARAGQRSEVTKDRGERARAALESLGGENGGGDAE